MIAWHDFKLGNHRARCPACGKSNRDKTLGVTIEADGRGVAHCFRCNYVETHRPDRQYSFRKKLQVHLQPANGQVRHQSLGDYGKRLWSECEPLVDTIAADYLSARRCALPPADGDLRFHPSVKHGPTGYVGPALVGLITHAVTREPLSLHRTWITATGKADIDPPRLLLGKHRKAGGVIRLWPDEAVTHGLGIAEGIETALSLAHAYRPVWVCIDAGNMAGLPVLAGIECLTIAADHDEVGMIAAQVCADRWTSSGATVRVVKSPKLRQDLNDLVQEVAA